MPDDLWLLGPNGNPRHRLLVGDARDPAAISRLMDNEQAAMVITDPPYNVPINGHVSGKGRTRHKEFAMASGEMTEEEAARGGNGNLRIAILGDLGGNGTRYSATTAFYMLRRLNIDPNSLTQSELHQARCTLLRAGIDLATAIAARYEGNFNYQPTDELLKRKIDLAFVPSKCPREPSRTDAASSLTPTLCPTLGAASAAFVEQQLDANHWDKQTAHQSRKSYELFGCGRGRQAS